MTVATKGRKTHGSPASTHFVCTRASSGGGECLNLQWDSSVIERHFKQAFPLFMDHYTRGDTDLDLTRKVNEHVSELQRDIELKQEALSYIVSAIEQGQGVQVFVSRAAALEAEIIGIREQIEDVRTQALPKTEDRAVRLERVIKLEKVLSTLDMGDVRTIAAKRLDFNAELRSIFSSIHLFWCYSHAQGVMVFVDHYGQEVLELQFQEGLEHGVALTLVEKVHDEPELGCTVSDEPELLFEFEPRHKELKTYVERSQQARGAAKRRLKEKTERAEELTKLGLLEGVIAGYTNEK